MKKHYNYDVAVITAVKAETEGIKRCYDEWEQIIFENDDISRYYETRFYFEGKEKKLVTGQQLHMGMTSCALTCMKLIEHFRPRYLIMAGIAAGIHEEIQMYGDVIIPNLVWDYSTGKFVSKRYSEVHFGDVGFLPRPSFMQLDDDLVALINEIAESKDHEFKIHMGMMACGNSVVASQHYVNKRVRSLMPQTLGLDMESYGVFYAARNCTAPRPKALVIKSICDYADEEKSDQYQKFAAYTSSRFAKWLIENKLNYD